MSKQIKMIPYNEKKHDEYFLNGNYMGCIHIRSNERKDICASFLMLDRDIEYGKAKDASEEFLKILLNSNCMKSLEVFNNYCIGLFGDSVGEKLLFFKDNINVYKIQVFCNVEKFNINVHINKV